MAHILMLIRRYGVWGGLRLIVDILHTRIFYAGTRIVRRPAYVRGARNIAYGAGFTAGVGLRLDALTNTDAIVLEIGDHVQVNDYVHIAAIEKVRIGAGTLIASKVFISDHHHGDYGAASPQSAPTVPPAGRPLVARAVVIGERVWIGEHVCVLPGVTIGDGAIIGAGAVVTKDVPEGTIAAGNPARILRRYNASTGTWDAERTDPQTLLGTGISQ